MRLIWTGGAVAPSRLAGLASAVLLFATPIGANAGDDIVDAPRAARELPIPAPYTADASGIPKAFDETDAVAALDGIRIALTEVADGGTYVWHRRDGRLSGMAQPTSSFRDQSGQPCRHIMVALNAFARSSKVEGIACRLESGRWQLTG